MRKLERTVLLAQLVWLAGCGGGGDAPAVSASAPTPVPAPMPAPVPVPAPTPAPAPTVAGASEGIWRTGLSGTYLLIEPDGTFWGSPDLSFGGLVDINGSLFNAYQGSAAVSSSGNVTGSFNDPARLTCRLAYVCKITGVVAGTQLSINGTTTLPGTNLTAPDWSFTGTKYSGYQTAALLGDAAGTWNFGALTVNNFGAAGQITVSASGSVSALNVGGCVFSGQLTPVASKGYFKLRLASSGGGCSVGSAAVSGVAYVVSDPGYAKRYLNIYWQTADASQYFWGLGVR